jgi:molybdopterin synthase sulfur carrier subunit
MIRVRLFAAVRELAGAKELELEAGTVADVLTQLSERLGPKFDEIMATGSVVVDGQRADPGQHLAPDAEVAVLPPVSGGASGGMSSAAAALVVSMRVERQLSR